MYKKIFSAILFGVLTIASTSTFVSCKDYDDDINNLQAQIDELNNKKIAEINSTIIELKNADAALQKAITDGDAATLAAAKTLIAEAIADCQKACKENLAKSQAEQDAKYDEAIAKVNQRVDDVLKLLSDQDGNIQEVGKQLQALSNKLSAFETEFGTLSDAFRDLKKKVTNLDDAVKAQKAEFDKKLEDLAKTIGTGTGSNGYDDASLKADIKTAGTRIDALEQSVKDLETKLTKMLNDEITAVKNTISEEVGKLNITINELRAAHDTFATKTDLSELANVVDNVKSTALQAASDITVLQTLVKVLASDLRSLVLMPKLYVDGIETIEYPYLKMALLHHKTLTPIKREEADDKQAIFDGVLINEQLTIKNLTDFVDVTLNDSIAYGPVWPVQYHMNPGNANTAFNDVTGWYVYESEVLTRAAFYDTKANAAATYGFTAREFWDNQYSADKIWSTTNGIMNVGLQIKDIEKIDNPGVLKPNATAGGDHFPSDLKENTNDGQSPESVWNVIAALQAHTDEDVAGNAGDAVKNIVTSDYAQILPEKVKLEGMIWHGSPKPSYWTSENGRIKDFWENKKGYGDATKYSGCATYDGGVAYKYRPGDGTRTGGRDEEGPICTKWVHVWDTPDEALNHPADIELYINKDVVLSEYLGVHWYFDQNEPITKNVADHKGIKTWKYGDAELRRYGFVWVFDTVDYYLEKNQTYDSRYCMFTNHQNGTIRAKNVDELGKTNGVSAANHSAVDREPLVRVRLYHYTNIKDMAKWQKIDDPDGINKFNSDNIASSGNYAPVLDGYIRVHITRPELKEITKYKYEFRPTFDLCNDWPTAFTQPLDVNTPKGHYTTWAQFDKWVLQESMGNMQKDQFDASYNPELDESPNAIQKPFNGGVMYEMVQYSKPSGSTNDNEFYHYKNLEMPNEVKSNPTKATDKIGHIYQIYDLDGTTNYAYAWEITAEEMEALTHDQTPWNKEVKIERYIHYTGHFYNSTDPNNAGAYYDDIFIKLTMIIVRSEVPTSEVKTLDENNWYNWEGSWLPYFKQPGEDRLQSIANNVPYPQDGLGNTSRTVPWRNNILYTWDSDKAVISNAGSSKFYFAPFEYDITAQDGTVYTITPRRGNGDNVFDKFICKYWNETHQYQLDKTNPFNSAKLLENNAIFQKCAIRYQPDAAGISKFYGMNVATVDDPSAWPKCDGVFSNDTLYAVKKSEYSSKKEYEPIAIIVTNETSLNTTDNYDLLGNVTHQNNAPESNFDLRDGAGQVILLHEYVQNKWLNSDDQPSGALWRKADTNPEIWQKENKYSEACVNAVGYILEEIGKTDGHMNGDFKDKGNPLKEQLRGYVGLIASQKCNIANQMKGNYGHDKKPNNFTVFQMSWERPVNMLQEYDFMVDAINNGDFLYIVDLIKLFDWRGASNKSEGDPTLDTGYMWGAGGIPSYWTNRNWRNNQWLWAYYNVRAINVDLRTSVVLTDHSHPGTFKPISDPSNANAIQLTSRGLRQYVTFKFDPAYPNGDGTMGFGADEYFPLRTTPRDYNAVSENAELIEYMGLNNPRVEGLDEVKAKFGYIRYENNGQNVHDFDVKLPVSIIYDWGELRPGWKYDPTDKTRNYITIHIKHTRGND